MLAAVFHGPDDLRVEDVQPPELPPGGLLVRTVTVGVCGSDVRTWHAGSHRFTGAQILGHEMAGVVVASDTEQVATGTEVAVCPCAPCLECRSCLDGRYSLCPTRRCLGYQLPGGMAEMFAVPADAVRAGCVVPVPGGIPLRYAPVAEPLHNVLNAHDRARTGFLDSVLVLGLGPVGILHVALARSRGAAPVLGVEPSQDRVDAAAEIVGPDHVLHMGQGWEGAARAKVDGRGWDVIVLANVAPAAVATAFSLIAPMGRIVAFSGLNADPPSVPVDWNQVHYRQIEIIGAFGGSPVYFRKAIEWLSASGLDLDALVSTDFSLANTLDAFAAVESGRGLKTMILVS